MSFLNTIRRALLLLFALAWMSSAASAVELSFEPDHDLPIVYVNVAVKAGAVADPAKRSGLTNFMGEMLLRGTRSRSKEQIDLALDQMGARLEVETRAEALILRGAVLSSQLAPFLSLVSEIVTTPSFPENEIHKLKSEITSGILEALGEDPSLASLRFTHYLFGNHPYGKSVLGSIHDVEAITRDDIVAHYDRILREDDLIFVGTGDAETQSIETWAARIAQARAGHSRLAKLSAPEHAGARRLLIVDKPDRTQTQINIGQIGVKMTDPDFFPLYLGNYAFGGGSFSARLMLEIRVKRGWSYGAGSSFREGTQPRSWQIHLFPASKDTAPALAQTLLMAAQLTERGITTEEFDFAQRSLVNGAGFMYDTPRKRVENTLLERTLMIPDGFMRSYAAGLRKVSLAQVNDALKRFLKPDHFSIVVLGTAKDLKAPLAKAAGVALEKVEVAPYTQE